MPNPDDGFKDEDVSRSLLRSAQRIFDERLGGDGSLEKELANFEKRPFGPQKRKLELEAKIKAKRIYARRLGNFVPLLGGNFRCPKCWLFEDVASSLSQRHVGHYRFSYEFTLECSRCRETFEI
jgi:hypothetical protein